MTLTPLTNILWWIVIAAECVAFFAAVARKLYADYPIFVLYVGFCAFRSIALRAIVNNDVLFFYAFWIGAVMEAGILAFLLWELARFLFAPWWIIPQEPKRWFYWANGGVLALSLLLPYSKLGSIADYYFWLAFARTWSRTISFAIFGISLLGIGLSIYLSIPWRRVATYLAVGLMLKFGFETWYWFALLDAPRARATSLQWITTVASIVAFGIWIGACFVPEHPPVVLTQEQLDEIEQSARLLTTTRRPQGTPHATDI